MEEKSRTAGLIPFSVCFSVGAVLFSSHAGGGFASGNQAYQNFVTTGWLAPFSALLAMLLFILTIREAMLMYNTRGLNSYKQLFETLYHPLDKLEWLFELFFYIMVLMAVGAAIATAASTLTSLLGLNYELGIVVVGAVVLVLTIFGAGLVRKASTVMGLGILACAITIFCIGIVKAPDLIGVFRTSFQGEGLSRLPQALLNAFTYAGFQCVVIPTMIVCGKPLLNKRACSQSMWISFGLNAVSLVLSVLTLMGWASFFTQQENGTTIPTLTVCQAGMGMDWLTVVYSACLLLCLISTGVTTVFGFVARFEKLRVLRRVKSGPVRSAIVSAFIIILAMTVSLMGLTNIIKYGYGYCGYLAIAIVIVPFLTVGVVKNRRFLREHPEYRGVSGLKARRMAAVSQKEV